MTIENGCAGHCCKCFYLPITPDSLWRAYQEFLLHGKDREAWAEGVTYFDQIELVAPALEHLGNFTVVERIAYCLEKGLVGTTDSIGCENHPGDYYRCRHQRADDTCAIYATRPDMCRAYPYGKPCRYPGCKLQVVDLACEEKVDAVLGSL